MLTCKKSLFETKNDSLQDGFTLVEVMVGTVIFVIAMMGMLGTTLLSYRYTLLSRYQERAANAVLSIADQFQNSPYIDKSNTLQNPKTLFADTGGATTGTGMAWDSTTQFFVYPGTVVGADTIKQGDSTDLIIPLNTVTDTDNKIVGHITRLVQAYNDPYSASATHTTSQMWLGTFSIKYDFLGTRTIQVQVLRTVTPTDLL